MRADFGWDEFEDDGGYPCVECGGWHCPSYCSMCGEIACSNCRCENEDGPGLEFGEDEPREASA
jgi:hypothetical protein